MDSNQLLALVLFVFVLIEAWQLRALLVTSRRQTSLIDQLINDKEVAGSILKNGILGLQDTINDPDNAEQSIDFFNFVTDLANTAWAVVKDQGIDIQAKFAMKKATIDFLHDLQADEEFQKELFSFIATAGAVAYSNAISNAKETVKETIKREIPVPKKWRWAYELYKEHQAKAGQGSTGNNGAGATGLLPLK